MTGTAASPFLTVVVPLYNESRRVQLLEKGLDEFLSKKDFRCEVVMVDDGSKDDTFEKVEYLARWLGDKYKNDEFRAIRLAKNGGRGGALKRGVEGSSGEWILTLDADMSVSPDQFLEWQAKHAATADAEIICIGDRSHPESHLEDLWSRALIGKVYNFIVRAVSGLDLRDTQCGCKLYPGELGRELFRSTRIEGWVHDVEMLLLAKRDGVPVRPLPVSWHHVGDSTVVLFRDVPRMLWDTVIVSLRSSSSGGQSDPRNSQAKR